MRAPTPNETVRLAEAMTGRPRHWKGRIVESGNIAGPWAPLTSAPKLPLMATIATDWVAFDADNPAARTATIDATAWARSVGAVGFTLESGGPDRAHGHVAGLTHGERARVTRWAKTRSIDVRTGTMIRVPGTPHRAGPAGRFLDVDPADVLDQLDRIPRQTRRASPTSTLSARTTDLLRHGHGATGADRYDHDDSRLAQAVILGLLRAGHTAEQIEAALADPRNAGGVSYRKRTAGAAKSWLDRSIKQARTYAPTSTTGRGTDVTPELAAAARAHLHHVARTERWRGYRLAVAVAAVDHAEAVGRSEFQLGRDQWAAAVGCSPASISRPRDTLADAGFLTVTPATANGQTLAPSIDLNGLFAKVRPQCDQPFGEEACQEGAHFREQRPLAHDVEGWGGVDLDLLAHVHDHPSTTVALAAWAGASYQATWRAVRKLSDAGLVAVEAGRNGHVIALARPDDLVALDVAAARLGRTRRVANARDLWWDGIRRRREEQQQFATSARLAVLADLEPPAADESLPDDPGDQATPWLALRDRPGWLVHDDTGEVAELAALRAAA